VSADQRIDTDENYCHFVTPEGFENGNDDNEEFVQGCNGGTIRQNQNGTGNGSILIEVNRPTGSLAFVGDYEFNGADTGIDCVMVDSNGTTYVTQDWDASYSATDGKTNHGKGKGKGHKKHLLKHSAEVKYSLTCRNGAQQ
jgi:hypothetical protein